MPAKFILIDFYMILFQDKNQIQLATIYYKMSWQQQFFYAPAIFGKVHFRHTDTHNRQKFHRIMVKYFKITNSTDVLAIMLSIFLTRSIHFDVNFWGLI